MADVASQPEFQKFAAIITTHFGWDKKLHPDQLLHDDLEIDSLELIELAMVL